MVTPPYQNRCRDLILYLSVNFDQLSTTGKGYEWQHPSRCPRCGGGRIWGHGYVLRFFDGLTDALWMKRWRCADCGAVHTMRPWSHWRGFWVSWLVIFFSLVRKESGGQWLGAISRQRQQYWWAGYRKQSRFSGPARSVVQLFSHQIIAATHSLTHREITAYEHPPHRIFAVTPMAGGP